MTSAGAWLLGQNPRSVEGAAFVGEAGGAGEGAAVGGVHGHDVGNQPENAGTIEVSSQG